MQPHCDKVKFIMVGELRYQKGYDILLDALLLLNGAGLGDKYHVTVVGGMDFPNNQEYAENLTKKVKERNITQIDITGHVDNPYPVMKLADWFLSTSRYEGQSISMQEAIVLGLPVIVTDAGGVQELLVDGIDEPAGILMETDAQSIYEKMKEVILNPDLKDVYKKRSLEISKKIDFKSRMEELERLF